MTHQLISFDFALQKRLRSQSNFGILEGFLSELLFSDIKIFAILESRADSEHSKQNQIDIKVEDSDGQLILIKIQYFTEHDYLIRRLFGATKGAHYSDVSKVISISILYFAFATGAGDDYIYHGTTEFFGLHNHHKLELNTEQKELFNSDKVADIFPEHYIINVRNFNDIAKEPLDEWIYFLKNEEVKEEFHAKGLLEAKEKLDILKLSSTEKAAYERHVHELRREASLYQSSYELGEIKGEAKGEVKGIELVAINLLRADEMSEDKIAQMTGLALKQVTALKSQL